MPAPLEIAVSWIAAQRPAMEDLLARLVSVNSFSGNREGANAVVDLLLAECGGTGLSAERIPSARFGDHLVLSGPARGAPFLLIGHSDTVYPPGVFEGYASDGVTARGPGVLDMKGGLVVGLFALRALARAGLLAEVPVRTFVVADEEAGSPESQAVFRQRAPGARAALGLESGRSGDLIVTRRKGVASVDAVARGVAAHAGGDHEKGRNAIWSLARFVDRAQALTDYGRGVTVSVGRIEGGTTRNTVPAEARCEVDLRYVASRDGEELLRRLAAAAREAELEGTRIEVRQANARPAMERTEASAALAVEYGECQREAGLGHGEAPLSGGGSDASVTAALGIPSIDGLGPRGRGFHTLDEQVELASLVPKAEALVRFLGRRAAGA
ncbi:MAG TPA: M20/M25/M40 family metallo-hydrolase [Anaeromyxobacteraceae bacterium]|nr:M20/M25/M40 family metallo-hydrolase [Anaeromyxobacteraceae bacterium]